MVEPQTKSAPAKAKKVKSKITKKRPRKGGKKTISKRKALGSGVFLYLQKYNKSAVYKLARNQLKKKDEKPKKPLTVVKQIGGDKNGGTRVVLLKKMKRHYPTMDRIRKRPTRKRANQALSRLRPSLTPGTVCILLAGIHKGKRCIFLKQLPGGLCLINGPFKTNAMPLRRVHQRYVIATSTKLDFTGVKIPAHINDAYFKHKREKRAKKEEGDIFNKKKACYKPTAQRKADQKVVDKLCCAVIKKLPFQERKLFYKYMSSMFGLRSSQYPHRLQF